MAVNSRQTDCHHVFNAHSSTPLVLLQADWFAVGRHGVVLPFPRRHLEFGQPAALMDALDHRVLGRAELEADIPVLRPGVIFITDFRFPITNHLN
jgi:hypothetical protein